MLIQWSVRKHLCDHSLIVLITFYDFRRPMVNMDVNKTILVTGGTGLVGQAIRDLVENEKPVDEKWIFVGSKDADLRFFSLFCVYHWLNKQYLLN